MIIFPAIDILDGKVVRLRQGDFGQVTVYNEDPVAQAAQFAMAGASWIHIVDLGGARDGVPSQLHVVKEISDSTDLLIQVGGGIRDLDTIERAIEAGASRAVLGSGLASDPEFARKAAAEFGPLIVAGIDARDGKVAIEGWREGTSTDALELAAELSSLGIGHLVYTDISRDGMQSGIDSGAYRRISQAAGFPVVASGGVSSLDDIRSLVDLGEEVIEGVIVGRALYEGSFTIDEAIAAGSGVDLDLYRAVLENLEAGEMDRPDFFEITEE